MSTSYVLIVFALVIVMMIFLISKCKVNAAMGIVLGCTMGTVLEKTGAAIRITKWAIGLVGEKNMIWAIALSSFILGIPIWADTVVILLVPIVSLLAVQTKKSMMSYGTDVVVEAARTGPPIMQRSAYDRTRYNYHQENSKEL